MADSTITNLPILTNPANNDVLPIVDISENTTKKIAFSALKTPYLTIDDPSTFTQNNVTVKINHPNQTNSSLVLTPQGEDPFILGPKPDGMDTGGDPRGYRSVDLQMSGNVPYLKSDPSNVCAGEGSSILGGVSNSISDFNTFSIIYGGDSNIIVADTATCIGGQVNFFSGFASYGASSIIGGANNAANAAYTRVSGYAARANRIGMDARTVGYLFTPFDVQKGTMLLRGTSINATPINLVADGSNSLGSTSISLSNMFVLNNRQTVMVDVFIVARSAGGTHNACYQRRCLIKREASAAATTLVGSVSAIGTDIESASAWNVTLTANTSYGGLNVVATGAASTSIRWFAELQFREVIRT